MTMLFTETTIEGFGMVAFAKAVCSPNVAFSTKDINEMVRCVSINLTTDTRCADTLQTSALCEPCDIALQSIWIDAFIDASFTRADIVR